MGLEVVADAQGHRLQVLVSSQGAVEHIATQRCTTLVLELAVERVDLGALAQVVVVAHSPLVGIRTVFTVGTAYVGVDFTSANGVAHGDAGHVDLLAVFLGTLVVARDGPCVLRPCRTQGVLLVVILFGVASAKRPVATVVVGCQVIGILVGVVAVLALVERDRGFHGQAVELR